MNIRAPCTFHLLNAHHKTFTLQDSIQRVFASARRSWLAWTFSKYCVCVWCVSLSEFSNSSVRCTDNTLIPTIYLDSDTGLIAGLAGGAGHIWPPSTGSPDLMTLWQCEYSSLNTILIWLSITSVSPGTPGFILFRLTRDQVYTIWYDHGWGYTQNNIYIYI